MLEVKKKEKEFFETMETDLLPNVRGNVQTLRHMWSTKSKEEENFFKSKSITQPKQSIKMDETRIKKEPMVKFDDKGKFQKT